VRRQRRDQAAHPVLALRIVEHVVDLLESYVDEDPA
jgi:hypothetical protein